MASRDWLDKATSPHPKFQNLRLELGRASLTRGNIGGSHTRGKSHSGDRTGWLGWEDFELTNVVSKIDL